jgi:hypothetical protein
VTYGVAELVKGARDAEDALKKFKEDNTNFVRPIVCSTFLSSIAMLESCLDVLY